MSTRRAPLTGFYLHLKNLRYTEFAMGAPRYLNLNWAAAGGFLPIFSALGLRGQHRIQESDASDHGGFGNLQPPQMWTDCNISASPGKSAKAAKQRPCCVNAPRQARAGPGESPVCDADRNPNHFT
jgi:hypothetical protein